MYPVEPKGAFSSRRVVRTPNLRQLLGGARVGRKVEREQLAGDGLRLEPVLCVDAALSVGQQEDAAAVLALAQPAAAAELHGHLAQLALPALRAQPLEVERPQLHGEVAAAVAAPVARVALGAERQHRQRDGRARGHAHHAIRLWWIR